MGEGLDLPEVSLIGILDADKEGFLRSETSLIQIIGRAARNVEGKVILYADHLTRSINSAISPETDRRKRDQLAYNKETQQHSEDNYKSDKQHNGTDAKSETPVRPCERSSRR